jgi:hypothetical protein
MASAPRGGGGHGDGDKIQMRQGWWAYLGTVGDLLQRKADLITPFLCLQSNGSGEICVPVDCTAVAKRTAVKDEARASETLCGKADTGVPRVGDQRWRRPD